MPVRPARRSASSASAMGPASSDAAAAGAGPDSAARAVCSSRKQAWAAASSGVGVPVMSRAPLRGVGRPDGSHR
ncbi:hypothetical protein ACGFSB_23630 [Streptomyces sp. NPDC048441]|uniref:hypothetical protein n=1 Tax=Streptomyces sp. NPDC048441 TaxID=3365552 RepID=UPI00371EBB72